jgi:hypothetical protein
MAREACHAPSMTSACRALSAGLQGVAMKPPRPPQARPSQVPLDTLGKLADRGFRLFGSCLDCSRRYDPKLGPLSPPSSFDIDLGALVAERGRECEIVGMPPVPCPRCATRRTEIRLLPPNTGSGDVVNPANT